jgi:hypothetical protein
METSTMKPEPPSHQYKHQEAYRLMKYATDDGSEVEWLWNSRDGVVPFCIHNRAGDKPMQHVQWEYDVRHRVYNPLPGERIFIDLTPEIALQWAEQHVERFWERSLSNHFDTRQQAIAAFAQEYLKPGAPAVVVVSELQAV